ncbi:small-conductance mechanosensitive channel MscS [Vibrio palustris]|uniref:Small-conductance mechanosensitive channel n=1 Tax=Vibrio palustris TaxID=1918946 RepID=A0A1R4B7R5_9VIBR|nr:small-conductance mechanosensitive channel MscS [Vibrio palustris]SJL84954.1 Small-conductance mechanosensitive channel [Vibrio palustris]
MASEAASVETNVISNISYITDWFSNNTDLLFEYSMNIIWAVLILFVGNIAVKLIANSVSKLMKKRRMDKAVIDFVQAIVRYLLFILVLIAALGKLGVQTASVVAVIGAAGLAVALALQGSLSNFAAGVLIVAFRPFKSGDYVEVGGIAGSVSSIQIFQTVLNSPDNKMIVVPNSSIIGGPITNYSRHKTRRIDFVIGVSYKADLRKTQTVLRELMESDERVLKDPEVTVEVHTLADSSVNFVVRPWVKTEEYWPVYWDMMLRIKETLDENGIEIPFPQMDVHWERG